MWEGAALVRENKGESFKDRLYRTLDIDGDIFGGVTLEMRGRGSVTARGCGRIIEYLPESIRLESGDGEILVRGRGLVCTSYRIGAVTIEGRIDMISFEGGEE